MQAAEMALANLIKGNLESILENLRELKERLNNRKDVN